MVGVTHLQLEIPLGWVVDYAFLSAAFPPRRCPTPSYAAIIIPQAGATLAVLGTTPANNAFHPSVLTMCVNKGIVLAGCARAAGEQVLEGVKTCRLVFNTSKGEVTREAAVPDKAPEMKVMVIPG